MTPKGRIWVRDHFDLEIAVQSGKASRKRGPGKRTYKCLQPLWVQGLISLWWEALPNLKSFPSKLGISECISDSQWYYCLENKVMNQWQPGALDFPAHILPPPGIFPGLLQPTWIPLFLYATSTQSPNHIPWKAFFQGRSLRFSPSLVLLLPVKYWASASHFLGLSFLYLLTRELN